MGARNGGRGRVPLVAPGELSPEQRGLYDAVVRTRGSHALDAEGRLDGPFAALVHSPTVGFAVQQLGAVLRYQGSLSGRAREAVILLTAREGGSSYETRAHEQAGLAAGLTSSDVDSLRDAGRLAAAASPEEERIVDLARRLLHGGEVGDEEYAQFAEELGLDVLVEVSTLVGYYSLLALQMRLFEIE